MAAQLVFRQKGDTHCPYHPGRKVEFQCEDCDGTLICALCMTSKQHKRHAFKELKDGLEEKVRNIEIFIENIEHEKIPEIDRHIKLIDDNISENESTHDSLIKNVTLHGKRLKDEVDLQTGQHVSVLDKRKLENNGIYNSHKKTLINLKQQLHKENDVIRKTCKSGTEIQVIDTESEISCKSIIIPETPKINLAKFEPLTNIQSIIQQTFGVISSTNTNTKSTSIEGSDVESRPKIAGNEVTKKVEKDGSSTTTKTTITSTTRISKTTRTSSANRDPTTAGGSYQLTSCKLLDKPELLSQFNGPCQPWALCPVSIIDMWILKYELSGSEYIYLVDHTGRVKKKIKSKQMLKNIVINPQTKELYGCSKVERLIVQIDTTNGSTRKVFNTEKGPLGISITSTGNFVIGMEYKVCMYTPTGTILHSYDCQGTPFRVSIRNDDRQVAVACCGSVLVFDDKLHKMYEYKGRDVNQPGEKREDFISFAAMFDSHTHLLVDDCQNHEIHLLDGRTGEFLRTLTVSGMQYPWCFGLHYDGDLLVGSSAIEKIRCIRYVQ